MAAANPNPTPSAPARGSVVLTPPTLPPLQIIARRTALLSAVFCAVMVIALLFSWARYQKLTPLDAPSIIQLKAQLAQSPQDEALKQQLRAEDLRLRTAHEHYLSLAHRGAWFLGGGAIVLLVSLQVLTWRRKLCVIKKPKQPGADYREMVRSNAAVAVLGVLIAGGALWLIGSTQTHLVVASKAPAPGGANTAASAEPLPSPEEFQRNWARFRGSDGCALSTQSNAPIAWDVKSGSNVVWTVPVPTEGHNSPIIWGDRLFISGGTPAKREVFCLDTKNGAILWQRQVENVPGAPAEQPEISEQTGIAAATMATDGRRVYAMFANGDLVAYTLDGTLAWAKSMTPLHNQYGHATSLLTWQGRLILQLDQGEADEPKSKLYAFDGATGKVIWQQPRKLPSSWASPIVIEAAGKSQIITMGIPLIISYSATDGAELWRAECLANEVTPSPVFAGGLVFAASPSEKLMAIRPDGQGDIKSTHFVWESDEFVPDVTSPVSNGELVYTINSSGMLMCYDAKTGKKQFEKDFELEMQSSPTIIGDRLYLLSVKGIMVVLQAGREYKELARSQLEDKFFASPAVAQNRIFLRGLKQLFCLGAKDDKLAAQK